MEDLHKYVQPSETIDSNHSLIRDKAADLTRGLTGNAEQAIRLFCFVRDGIKYNPYVELDLLDNYQASKTMNKMFGFCVEKAAVLAALARSIGIPSRLHLADIRNHLAPQKIVGMMGTNIFSYHGYTELFIGGRWIKATPAFDLKMCQENRFVPVEFDGTTDAIFSATDIDGKPHIEYVLDRGIFLDVPGKQIVHDWVKMYADGSRELYVSNMKALRSA